MDSTAKGNVEAALKTGKAIVTAGATCGVKDWTDFISSFQLILKSYPTAIMAEGLASNKESNLFPIISG